MEAKRKVEFVPFDDGVMAVVTDVQTGKIHTFEMTADQFDSLRAEVEKENRA